MESGNAGAGKEARCLSEPEFLRGAQRLIGTESADRRAAVCFHIRQFRFINERFGFFNADKVLYGAARILASEAGPGELCAHRFADQFLLLLSYSSREELKRRFVHIADRICEEIEFTGIHYGMEVFFGVCEQESGGSGDIRALVNCATIAQREGPARNGECWRFYSGALSRRLLTLKNMEDRLAPAMADAQFVIYYQPKFDLRTLRPCGCEALVRWRAEPDALVAPGEFIPEFEKSGSIAGLDVYMFRHVCEDLRRWADAGTALPVSVNLSRTHLRDPGLAREYAEAARSAGAPLALLELEVTESAAAQDPEQALKAVRALRGAGFRISIDDFGTGYSSLGMLADFPADAAKLDRSFLSGITENPRRRIIAEHTVALLKRLGILTVAEGVENEAQLRFLREIGCDAAQGFSLGVPLPRDAFEDFLAKFRVPEGRRQPTA